MLVGKIDRYFQERGFGFIQPDNGDADIFVHINELPDKQIPKIGALVGFEVEDSPKGPRAVGVTYLKARELVGRTKPEL